LTSAPQSGSICFPVKKAHPEKSVRTLSYGISGLTSRKNVQRMVKLKHEVQAAPA
jgi:para-nitrobenzyl esterase